MHAHLSGDVPENHVAVFQLDAKRRVREILENLPLHLDYVVFRHARRVVCFLFALASYLGKPVPNPLKFAFFSKLSYWCVIMYACTCAMKSIVTTTTISSDVPPK